MSAAEYPPLTQAHMLGMLSCDPGLLPLWAATEVVAPQCQIRTTANVLGTQGGGAGVRCRVLHQLKSWNSLVETVAHVIRLGSVRSSFLPSVDVPAAETEKGREGFVLNVAAYYYLVGTILFFFLIFPLLIY